MCYLEQYAEYVLNNYLGMHIRTLECSKKYIFPISFNRCVHKQKKGVISKISLLFDSDMEYCDFVSRSKMCLNVVPSVSMKVKIKGNHGLKLQLKKARLLKRHWVRNF